MPKGGERSMPITEVLLTTVTGAVFGHVLRQANLGDQVRRTLNREPKQLAFQRALGKAIEHLEREHSEWTSTLFDASFFEREGAPILAQFWSGTVTQIPASWRRAGPTRSTWAELSSVPSSRGSWSRRRPIFFLLSEEL